MKVTEFPGRTIFLNGKTHFYFGGTSYLGMATLPEFQNLYAKNLKKWGTAYGSSRKANIKLAVYESVEQKLAKWIGSEAALTVSSGTLAGLLALQSFEATHDFFHLPDTHPAILHPDSKNIDWKDADFADSKLNKQSLLVGDSFPSKQVKPLNWNFRNNLSTSLLVDDSHGLGFTGTDGSGVFKTIDKTRFEDVLMIASLGKALGINGGVIAGSQARIEKIKQLSSFAGASGMSPAALATYFQADHLYANQRQKLIETIAYLNRKTQLSSTHFIFDKNYPVVYSQHADIAAFLQTKNIVIAHFDYPNPGQTLNRIVLTAAHNSEDLDTLAVALHEFTHQKI